MEQEQSGNREYSTRGQSFLIRIQFRQNNCWQGSVQWLEGQKTHSFRSVLDLILKINEALDSSEITIDKQVKDLWELNRDSY